MRARLFAALLLLAALVLCGCRYVVVESDPVTLRTEASPRP